jgi:hypothetical protein
MDVQHGGSWTELNSATWCDDVCCFLEVPAGTIKGCIVMHPFFGFMQKMKFYDVEMRTSKKLIANQKLPGTYLTYMSHTKTVPSLLRPLQEFLETRHPMDISRTFERGVITHLTTYDRYMTEAEVIKRGYPLLENSNKTIYYLNVSNVRIIHPPLEVQTSSDSSVRTRLLTHIRKRS